MSLINRTITFRKKSKLVINYRKFIYLLLFVFQVTSYAAPFQSMELTYSQPNGELFAVTVSGDELYAIQETVTGYTIIQEEQSKLWCYATVDNGEFTSSGISATSQPLSSFTKHLRESSEVIKQKVNQRKMALGYIEPTKARGTRAGGVSITGDFVGLTLLIDFPDETSSYTQAQFDAIINEPNYSDSTNDFSIYDYFYVQSNGRLRYNNIVTQYYTAKNPKGYYDHIDGGKTHELINEAIASLKENGFDFSQLTTDSSNRVLALNVLYAGYPDHGWSKGLWPHQGGITINLGSGLTTRKYQITNIGNNYSIGTFIHENGHMICQFPDLYNYEGKTNTMVNYCTMASGWGGHPKSICGALKYDAGWVDPVELTSASHLRASLKFDDQTTYIYRNPVRAADDQEYFLFEVRSNQYGHEAGLGTPSGLAIYHCLEGGSNSRVSFPTDYSKPYRVMVVKADAADNSFYLEGADAKGTTSSTFHASGVDTVSEVTTPSLDFWDADSRDTDSGLYVHSISAKGPTMTFTIGQGAVTDPAAVLVGTTVINNRCDFQTNAETQTLSVANSAGGTLNYTISSNQTWLTLSQNSGSITTDTDLIDLNFITNSLSPGAHNATITVTNTATNVDTIVAVTLTVNAPPVTELSRTSYLLTSTVGEQALQQLFTIKNSGEGFLSYNLTSDVNWISFTPSSGQVGMETDTIYINFDTDELVVDTYNAQISVENVTMATTETINLTLTVQVVGAQEVAVFGKDQLIPSGSTTIDTTLGTQLYAAVGDTASATFEIENEGTNEPLLLSNTRAPSVSISGTNANQFQLVQPSSGVHVVNNTIAPSSSASFAVLYTPTEANVQHTATVTVSTNDVDEPNYTFAIQGHSLDIFPPNNTMPAHWTAPVDSVGAWEIVNSEASEGFLSLSTSGVNNAGYNPPNLTSIEFTGQFNAGNITLKLKTECTNSWDGLIIYLDDTVITGQPNQQAVWWLIDEVYHNTNGWDGTNDWTAISIPVTAGEHKLTFTYSDGGWTTGDGLGRNRVWIDELVMPTITGNQAITFNPIADKTFGDSSFTLSATSDSTLPVYYTSSNPQVAAVVDNEITIFNAGTTQITANQPGSAMFSPTTQSQNLVINQATQVITFSAIPSLTYGDDAFELTAQSDTGLAVTLSSSTEFPVEVNGNMVKVLSAGENRVVATPAGSANYATTATEQVITAQPLAVAVDIQDLSLEYGSTMTGFTYQVNGLINGDTTTGTPAFATVATAQSAPGPYAITATQGDLSNSNYSFSFTPGELTITAKDLTITANNQAGTVGEDLPALTYTAVGFANSEDVSDLVGTLSITTTATNASPEGDYPITISGVSSPNYNITFNSGTLEVLALTPMIGAEVTQNGELLTWTIEQEIDVKEYQISSLLTGEIIAIIPANGGQYSYDLGDNIQVKLIVVDHSGFTQVLFPEAGNKVSIEYNLTAGWNMISAIGTGSDLSQLQATISGDMWGWNGYSYEVVKTVAPGDAVWVYAPEAADVIVIADKSENQLKLEQGWNMTGPTENMATPAEATVIYSWNQLYHQISVQNQTLLRGVGYWIFCF